MPVCQSLASQVTNTCFAHVSMVDNSQAFSTDNNCFDRFKSMLMISGPIREHMFHHFCCQWSQNGCMVSKVWKKQSHISHQTQERSDISRQFRSRAIQYFVDPRSLGFDAPCRIQWLRNSILSLKNWHFFGLQYSLAFAVWQAQGEYASHVLQHLKTR